MSTLMLISVIALSSIELTSANARRLERIETNIKSLDLKLNAYSLDISILKRDVADTNKKLDLILEIMNGTTTTHQTSHDTDTTSANNRASNPVPTLNDLEVRVQRELNRVRRAFVTEKKKLSQQQRRNNFEYHEFAGKLNDNLAVLNDRNYIKWTVAANSINQSVVSLLGTVRDHIDYQLNVWNQSIHKHLNENTNKTLSKLGILGHSIGSWNDSIHKTLIDVDQKCISSITSSVIEHDTFTKNLQNELTSSMTKIHDTVHSFDYDQSFVNIHTKIQSLEDKTDSLLYKLRRDSVRLVNSRSWNQGRLEVYIDGNWGTVCDDNFNNTAATVACRMFGYRTGIFKDRAYFGKGKIPILMNRVSCRGKEKSIHECTYEKIVACGHHEDVGVICTN